MPGLGLGLGIGRRRRRRAAAGSSSSAAPLPPDLLGVLAAADLRLGLLLGPKTVTAGESGPAFDRGAVTPECPVWVLTHLGGVEAGTTVDADVQESSTGAGGWVTTDTIPKTDADANTATATQTDADLRYARVDATLGGASLADLSFVGITADSEVEGVGDEKVVSLRGPSTMTDGDNGSPVDISDTAQASPIYVILARGYAEPDTELTLDVQWGYGGGVWGDTETLLTSDTASNLVSVFAVYRPAHQALMRYRISLDGPAPQIDVGIVAVGLNAPADNIGYGIYAVWRFDGDTLSSPSNVNYNMADPGATFTTGKLGQAVASSPSDLLMATNFVPDDFTLSGWVLIPSGTAGNGTGGVASVGPASNRNVKVTGATGVGYKLTNDVLGSTGVLPAGWHHFALTYTHSLTDPKLYVDGELALSTTASLDTTNAKPRVNPTGADFANAIDMVVLHSRALTAHQVGLLYNGGAGLDPTA